MRFIMMTTTSLLGSLLEMCMVAVIAVSCYFMYIILLVETQNSNTSGLRSKIAIQQPGRSSSLPAAIERQTDRPTAVILIGPHKTGTSSIQAALKAESAASCLEGYFYLDRWNKKNPIPTKLLHANHFKDDNGTTPYDMADWEPYREYMQTLLASNQSYIASDEALARSITSLERLQPLQQALEGFHVRVVATYRRYTEWLVSFYTEKNKYNTEHAIPSFAEDFANNFAKTRRTSLSALYALYGFYPYYMQVWKNLTEDFVVFNYHEHSRERFVSEFLSTALNATCDVPSALSHSTNKDFYYDRSNESPSKHWFEALRVTIVAVLNGLITLKEFDNGDDDYEEWLDRREQLNPIVEQIASFMDQHQDASSWPWICPSQAQLDEIWRRSEQLEQMLLPDYHNAGGGREVLRASFDRAVAEQWYCNLNVEQVLQLDEWKEFLQREFQ